MEGCSSDGSSPFFTSKKPNGSQFPYQTEGDVGWFNFVDRLVSLTGQDQLNQVEASEGSYQTKSGGGRSTLTLAQRRESKRQSDSKYRQKRKIAAEEQTAENKHLKEENERLSAETRKFKKLMRLLLPNSQLPAEVTQRLDSYITQSNGKQLEHHNASVQSRREMTSERINILRDLVPGCGKVNEAPLLLLDEIINYIQSLQRQAEFLSTKLATVNPRVYPTIEAFPYKDDHHGTNSGAIEMLRNLQEMTPASVVPTNDYVTGNQKNPETGTFCNDETPITELLTKIDADEESKVKISDFTGLDGERIEVGKYGFPISLHPTVEKIIDACGDISATSKMNISAAETIYIMFCASVKEMSDLHLEQVTEDRIWKWRDAIKDASRISFKVDFAMEHLKKIVHGYIGLMELRKLKNVASRISKLEAELSAGKQEHAQICEESKVYMDVAEEFNGKPVSSGMFQSLAATN